MGKNSRISPVAEVSATKRSPNLPQNAVKRSSCSCLCAQMRRQGLGVLPASMTNAAITLLPSLLACLYWSGPSPACHPLPYGCWFNLCLCTANYSVFLVHTQDFCKQQIIIAGYFVSASSKFVIPEDQHLHFLAINARNFLEQIAQQLQ